MTEPALSAVDANLVFEIEQRIEGRWLGEFEQFTLDQEEKLKRLHGQYRHLLDWMQRLLEQVNSKTGSQFGWNLDLKDMSVEQRSELAAEAVRIFQMGQHFDALIKEVERQPALQAHWEQFCVLLRLSEDDETVKYYRF